MIGFQPSKNDLLLLALTRYGEVGPRIISVLLQRFGEPEEFAGIDRESLLQIEGLADNQADKILEALKRTDEAGDYLAGLHSSDIRVISRLSEDYPEKLFEINDPPTLLFVRGILPDATRKSIAIVGADLSTNDGINLTVSLARKCVESSVQVISSLRRGIDAAAHIGARAGEGASFAVLDTGFDHIDLTEQMPVAVDIVRNGGVLSEFLPDSEPSGATFHRSSRLIVGLAQAVVVTELYSSSTAALDLLSFCGETGKLAFVLIDPRHGALADEAGLSEAIRHGAIPMSGLDKIDDIISSLV